MAKKHRKDMYLLQPLFSVIFPTMYHYFMYFFVFFPSSHPPALARNLTFVTCVDFNIILLSCNEISFPLLAEYLACGKTTAIPCNLLLFRSCTTAWHFVVLKMQVGLLDMSPTKPGGQLGSLLNVLICCNLIMLGIWIGHLSISMTDLDSNSP